MPHRCIHSSLCRGFAFALLAIGFGIANSNQSRADQPKRVLMIAGKPSHGYGAHEHYAGLKLLQDAVGEANPAVHVDVVRGWPTDAKQVDQADALVIYCDGSERHLAIPHLDRIRRHLESGKGLVALHYATEMQPGVTGQTWQDLLGGHFEVNYSVNPHWRAEFASFPDHPITSGVKPFATQDEWYFHLRFEGDGELTPILQAVAPEHTLRRPDGLRSGNPAVRKSVAAKDLQTVAWAYQPPFGGRSFGFTGGHNHWNWADPGARRVVTNAILWAAGSDVIAPQASMDPVSDSALLQNQDSKPPKNFSIGEVRKRFGLPPAAAVAANTPSGAKPSHPKQLFLSPMVTSGTDGHRVKIDLRLDQLDSGRNLYLVVTDGGDGNSCDWADWVDPKLTGPAGEISLVDLPWESATSEYGRVSRGTNCVGKTAIVSNQRAESVIGVHASSLLHYQVPEGYDRFTAVAGLDKGGIRQNGGKTTSVRFAILTGTKPADPSALTDGLNQQLRQPSSAVAAMEVADGLEATLMASEPVLSSLTNLDIDHRGRVWVCDVMNYRRNRSTRPEGDRILILEDTTGDGSLDSVKTFYQGRDIDSAVGICVLGNEVIVTASPTIWRFIDHDGDDVPDEKIAMFTETGQYQHDHSAHSFLFGPDGKLYWNFGNTGYRVKDAEGKIVIDIHGRPVVDNGNPFMGGMPFRCDLDGSNFEVLAHNFRNNWETTVDSFGTIWQSDNDDDGNRATRINFVMEQGNYGYRDELTRGMWRQSRITMDDQIPRRHWHLNDPGVVPNLLLTGAGSPSGICVYEGRLLPRRFWDEVIHCDPGPNVVRAYPVTPDGAGYQATIQPLVTGVTDKWFRPVDVCVAPDGSLFVTDWYDPGVGGHRQKDSDRGRLFRIAPPGHVYQVPRLDLTTASGAAAALRSPNHATRFMAWRALQSLGDAGRMEVAKLLDDENPRIRARAFWFLGKQPQTQTETVETALADSDPDIRILGIRLAKQLGMSPSVVAGHLAEDDSIAVCRELALALRFDASDAMPQTWASLAVQHDGKDRWYLEALGIGSDQRPAECFAAWSQRIGDQWDTPGGRDILWRVRAPDAAERMVDVIAELTGSLSQTDRYFRAMEYHPPAVRDPALGRLASILTGAGNSAANMDQATVDALVVRSVMRMSQFDGSNNGEVRQAINRHTARSAGTPQYLDLVRRFRPDDADQTLKQMMLSTGDDTQSLAAMRVLLDGPGGFGRFVELFGQLGPGELDRVAGLLGSLGNQRAVNLLSKLMELSGNQYPMRASAVRSLAKSQLGSKKLLEMAAYGDYLCSR